MEINTKAWIIKKKNKKWIMCKRPYIIKGFALTPSWTHVGIEKKEVLFKNFIKERKDCFATQAEAQAECDKRNKGE